MLASFRNSPIFTCSGVSDTALADRGQLVYTLIFIFMLSSLTSEREAIYRDRRSMTAAARSLRTLSVVSKSMQASVIDTPYLRWSLPAGTF